MSLPARNNKLPDYYHRIYEDVCRFASAPEGITRHFEEDSQRIIDTVDLLKPFDLKGKRVCEIGFGGVGLACALHLEAIVDAYDLSDAWKPICDHYGIKLLPIDLNKSASLPNGPYDLILLCEVIEHLARWPVDIFIELRKCLAPNGMLFISTPNLARLSNRIRLLLGKPLFVEFVPEELVRGHLREYLPEEMVLMLRKAGFAVDWKFACFPDGRKAAALCWAYRVLCKTFPKLSNYFFCLARAENAY